MTRSIRGQVALVIAGASGIGLATARRLSAAGARVAIGSRRIDAARIACRTLPQSIPVQIDLRSTDLLDSVTAQVSAALGPISLLVNAAGDEVVRAFVQTSEPEWRHILEVNFVGAVSATRTVLPGMLDRGYGRVVHVTSEGGVAGAKGSAAYTAAKAALAGYVRALGAAHRNSGVTINCVSPGPTETELFRRNMDLAGDRYEAALKRLVPLRRFADPDEIAGAIQFVIAGAGEDFTGQRLSVGGGITRA